MGFSRNSNGRTSAFIWTEALGMQEIGDMGRFVDVSANGIDDDGRVVGDFGPAFAGSAFQRAFLWEDGILKDLTTSSSTWIRRSV